MWGPWCVGPYGLRRLSGAPAAPLGLTPALRVGVLGLQGGVSAGEDTKAHNASQSGGGTPWDALSNVLHLTPSPARRAGLRESLIAGKSALWVIGLKNLVGFKNLPSPGDCFAFTIS